MNKNPAKIVQIINISKSFPGVSALQNVTFELLESEVHALVGENGAGKSTLMHVLNGEYRQDGGEIYIDGELVDIASTHKAKSLGISMVHQELQLVNSLNVAENVYMGRIPKGKLGFVDRRKLYKRTEELLQTVGVNLDLKKVIGKLSVAQKQFVELAKALSYHSRVIIMDEPSATLTENETQQLFNVINSLKKQGVSIIYISHRIDEVFAIADRVTVLKDGRLVDTKRVAQIENKWTLMKMMVGRELGKAYPPRTKEVEEEVLKVQHIYKDSVLKDISFSLKRGEILGISGLIGSGRTDLARIVYGAECSDQGEMYIYGKKVNITSPKKAIDLGVVYLTEDRKDMGLFINMDVKENITIAAMHKVSLAGFIKNKIEEKLVHNLIKRFSIKTPTIKQKIKYLSGGNQQKVILARLINTDARILILDEPTRGIDVGSKEEIYRLMRHLCNEGCSIIMISSELPELLGMSDRILVMSNGRITGEFYQHDATEDKIMECAAMK